MLPKTLQHHWQHLQITIADTFTHHGLDWLELWKSLEHDQQQRLQKVLCLSDYVVDSLSHQGDYFANALRSDSISQPLQRADFSRWLDEFAQNAKTEDDWHVALRHLRRRAMVHIIWCDLLRIANTLDTTRTLSELADECVCRSLEFLATDLHTRHGKPMGKESNTEQQLLVLGMGKLGAYELNLSSDIDLIFTYPESGNTSGPRVISNQEYFVKLGQKLIQALDKQTVDGFVFRTDMRLRPFGDSGPLVMNFASLENYYATQGRDWERYAMVKARVMNGESSPDAKELLSILRPFTYRVYVDFSAFASLRSLKEMINAEVRRRGLENNIKLGAGGIREIEFIVQAFQLIRGGQDRLLQSRGLCRVLDILGAEGYLPLDACQQLRQAYLFLRDSEHAIQALADEQTQQLPDNDLDQARVAWAFGYEEWDSYLTQLTQHRAHVSLHFDHIVADDQDQEKTSDSVALAWIDCWHGELDGDAEIAFLMQFPCDDFDAIKKILAVFRESRAVRSMQAIGHDRLEELMPLLLRQVWQQQAPAIALERLIPLLEAVLRRTAYLVLLKENPQALEQLVRLCSASSWVAQYITDTPLLLDELLNVRNLYRLPTAAELREELH
ncbi:MAG: bifunctional [glutamate--ammonia ligase]-adenylyl-L-tyrosine phosphorylase/[glutamate--ammonia-ligase] adenylyltransferase, partial [Oleibacter sp.]|nr:bifunctional [glutamate--ammonia ligase]-adenylyl-L-tyrosine phosphorylase/[glutamate--ammonia-ligase] adenylyltransferase [Thalassolituus sp.]